MAIEILQETNDGNDLGPQDLYFLQSAVNGLLTDAGIEEFRKLHKIVKAGEYKMPWFHGVENLTIRESGYVYWRDKCVEHYSFPYSEDSRVAAIDLGKRCEHLEKKGTEISISTVIFQWEGFN